MKPVNQTIFMGGLTKPIEEYDLSLRGNCLQACIASIFELSLEEVPHFIASTEWPHNMDAWFAERNLVVWFTMDQPWNAYYIKAGLSPRSTNPEFPMYHATVAMNGEIVHDPNPAGGGLKEHTGNWVFAVKDPSKL